MIFFVERYNCDTYSIIAELRSTGNILGTILDNQY